MVRNNITLRVLTVGWKNEGYMPYIRLTEKARRESGFEVYEIIRVGRSGQSTLAVVGKQAKAFVSETYACSLSKRLVANLPCLPDDEVALEGLGNEMYDLLGKFPTDEIENVMRLITPQEIGKVKILGYSKKELNKAVSLQCMSKMFTAKVNQALKIIPDFKIRSGRMLERFDRKEFSKLLCQIKHSNETIDIAFVPKNKDTERKNKFEVNMKRAKKKVYCKTLNEALDKALKHASKVIAQ